MLSYQDNKEQNHNEPHSRRTDNEHRIGVFATAPAKRENMAKKPVELQQKWKLLLVSDVKMDSDGDFDGDGHGVCI